MDVPKCRPEPLDILGRQHSAHVEITGEERRPVQRCGEAADDHKLDVSVAQPLN
jgi:hypothetical protein